MLGLGTTSDWDNGNVAFVQTDRGGDNRIDMSEPFAASSRGLREGWG